MSKKEKSLFFDRIMSLFFPDKESRNISLFFFLLIFFKILWFNYSWCSISTFRPFSFVEMYVWAVLLALILIFPVVLFRSVRAMLIIDIFLGLLLLSNLLYFRTYYTAIPLSSYVIVDNMTDFMSSIYNSFRFGDILFPASTVVVSFFYYYIRKDSRESRERFGNFTIFWRYMSLIVVFVMFAGVFLLAKGGFKKAYESLQDSYTHTCGPPIYTVFGSAYYDYVRDKEFYTVEIGRSIEDWMDVHKKSKSDNLFFSDSLIMDETPVSCIIIFAESLESWLLEQTVEGQEIMPGMNRLLQDSTTIYAPNVLSQVKGGRSIDAQLILNAGLLPINNGAYSLKYPNTLFHSLAKAIREKYGVSANMCTLTSDKPMVWNQNVILPTFGYDSLVTNENFKHDEKAGPHYRLHLGDVSLLRQCAEKINKNEVWAAGVNLLQIITYSGHFPFTIPNHLKEISFSDDVPELMGDYMTTANYTDRALTLFIDALKSDPKHNNTLIVIVGDHEGLGATRAELCSSDIGQGVVSEHPFVPLIIANIPDSWCSKLSNTGVFDSSSGGFRYDKVLGQIDIYPTLIDLLGLTDYIWGGLGYSIFNPENPNIAVTPYGMIYGDTTDVDTAIIRHLNDAWVVSDEIIRYNYWGRSN